MTLISVLNKSSTAPLFFSDSLCTFLAAFLFCSRTNGKQSQGFQKNCSAHSEHSVSHEHRKLLACKSARDNYQSRFTAVLAQQLSFRLRWSLESCLTRANSLVGNLFSSHFRSTFPWFPAAFPSSAVLPFGCQGNRKSLCASLGQFACHSFPGSVKSNQTQTSFWP